MDCKKGSQIATLRSVKSSFVDTIFQCSSHAKLDSFTVLWDVWENFKNILFINMTRYTSMRIWGAY